MLYRHEFTAVIFSGIEDTDTLIGALDSELDIFVESGENADGVHHIHFECDEGRPATPDEIEEYVPDDAEEEEYANNQGS